MISPPHVLQETLDALLENRMTADIRPHTIIPIPLLSLKQTSPRVPLSTAPFVTELRTAAAIWQPLLPLRIYSDTVPALGDIVRYSVVVKLFRHMMGTGSHFRQNRHMLIQCFRDHDR
jgi:hypothetical protein